MLSSVCHRQLNGHSGSAHRQERAGMGNLIMCPDAEKKVLYAHCNIQSTQNGNVILCSSNQLNKLWDSVARELVGEQNKNQSQSSEKFQRRQKWKKVQCNL